MPESMSELEIMLHRLITTAVQHIAQDTTDKVSDALTSRIVAIQMGWDERLRLATAELRLELHQILRTQRTIIERLDALERQHERTHD